MCYLQREASGSSDSKGRQATTVLTLSEPQSRFGDKPLKYQVVCPQNGTAVLKGLTAVVVVAFPPGQGGKARCSRLLSRSKPIYTT